MDMLVPLSNCLLVEVNIRDKPNMALLNNSIINSTLHRTFKRKKLLLYKPDR